MVRVFAVFAALVLSFADRTVPPRSRQSRGGMA